MKRIYMLIVSVLVSIVVTADNVTSEQAEQIAIRFLSRHRPSVGKQLRMAQRKPLDVRIASDATAYYAFNVGDSDGNGFVIVSGSDLAPQVLAFSEKGSFKEESMPTNMKAWLDGYVEQIAYLERTKGKYEAPRLGVQRSELDPLLTSTWGQGAPYNDKCPIDPDNGERCVTGCVATALAQVVNYYKYPSRTQAIIPAYTFYREEKEINMPSIGITSIDWDNIIDSYDDAATTAQKNAVAQLMLLCGQATKMEYSSRESSAFDKYDVAALQRYFGFDKTVRVLDRNAFSTIEWESLVYEEIAAERPVLYGGQSTGGGHAFVVDGYRDGLFHINWGWDGNCDSYFLLSILNPYDNSGIGASSSHYGYSFEQDAVVGIQHGTEEVVPERIQVFDIKNAGSSTYTRTSTNENFTDIKIQATVYNTTGDTHNFLFGLALFDTDDEMVMTLGGGNLGSKDFRYGGTYTINNAFGAGLPNGNYYIVPVSASENSTVLEPCWRSNVYRIKAKIQGNTLTLIEPSVELSATMQSTGQPTIGSPCSITAQITNNGSYFNDYVYLIESDGQSENLVDGRMLEVAEGQTTRFDIDYVPLSMGGKVLYLVTIDEEEGYYKEIAHVSVSVGTHLSYEISIQNLNDNGFVAGGKVMAKVKVKNNGVNFDDDVKLQLRKKYDDNGNYSLVEEAVQHLTLTSGGTKTLDFSFDDLEGGQNYVLDFKYKKTLSWFNLGGQFVFFSTDSSSPQLTLSATPNSGVINYKQEVTLAANNPSAKIYYTFNGSEPTQNSSLYKQPLQIERNLTLKAKAFLSGYEPSETLTKTYQVKLDIEADRASGNVSAGQKVTLSCSHPEAIIYYTTDGSTPTKQSKVYNSPIVIDNTMTLKVIAMHDDCLSSDVLTRNYVVSKVTLSINPSGGTVQKGTKVSITPNPINANIFYTTDGSEPTKKSTLYESPINIQKNTSIRAIGFAEGYATSDIITAEYKVKLTLQASLAGGTVDYLSKVVLTADEPAAKIYYTMDGSTPTQESLVYNDPIVIDESKTIKAIAYHDNYLASDVIIRTYAIRTATLAVSPNSYEYLKPGTNVTLTANPSDCRIYYTTDGSEPTESSTLYSSPIIAEKSFVLKAKAFRDRYKPSNTLVKEYKVSLPDPDPNPVIVHIMPSELELIPGQKFQLTYSIEPANADVLNMTWESSNTDVAIINQHGFVEALQPGYATLTATTHNGVVGICELTVRESRLRFYVWLRNNEVHGYDLEEYPNVYLGETVFKLITASQEIRYDAAEILQFTLQNEEIVDYISVPKMMEEIQFREGTLLFADCSPYSPVHIFDTAGRMVQTAKTDGEGNLTLSLASLRTGIYLIKTETTTIKIQKR